MSKHMRTTPQKQCGKVPTPALVGIALAVVAALVAVAVFVVVPRLQKPAGEAPKATSQKKDDKGEEQKEPTDLTLAGKVKEVLTADVVSVKPEGSGVVSEVRVVDGQQVNEGDVLLVIGETTTNDAQVANTYQALQAAQAEYSAAKSDYDALMTSIDAAINEVGYSHDQWEAEYAAWAAQMEQYEAAVADAEWRLENNPDYYDENGVPVANIYVEWPGEAPMEPVLASEAYAAQADADLRVSNAAYAVETAYANYNAAVANSSSTAYREVTATASGTVGDLKVQVGTPLNPDDPEPALQITGIGESSARITAFLEEGDGDRIELGSSATIAVKDVEGLKLDGRVTSVDAKEAEFTVDAVDDRVKADMDVTVTVRTKEADKTEDAEDDAGEEAPAEDQEKDEAEEPAAADTKPAAATVDVSHVDLDVAAMSDEEAFQFMHDFGNRTPDEHAADFGKVMHIKGQVSKYTKVEDDGDKVSYRVGIKGEGGTIWGVNFYVEGWGPDDYPQNKDQVEVTGVYGEVEGYGTDAGKTLICNPEDVKRIEQS